MEVYHLAGQGRIKRALEPILIKNEKPSLSSFLPALQGERCARAGICGVVEREPLF